MTQPEVLIVGAGPTGLVLALWLTKIGIPVRIIDKAEKPGTTSRAIVMHARNLEFYHQMGIDKMALEQGLEFKSGNLWLRGKNVAKIPFGDFAGEISPYPYALVYTQDLQEQMLSGQLAQRGVTVERSTELIDFKTSAEKVTVQLQKNGRTEQCTVKYLAGCDGARSTVREKSGIGFPGGTYSDIYYVADILASGPAANAELNIALDDADFLAIFPMKGEGRIRLVGALKEIEQDAGLKWEDVNQSIIKRLKMDVKEVKWFSTYRVHHRVANNFSRQRCFLAGDAAHVHSPVGGQGMNTGIGDAVNLAWKLGAVIKGAAPVSLLDTYEPERIAFARKLVATTDRVFEFVSSRGRLANWIRLNIAPRLFPLLFGFESVRRFAFLTLSQTAIKYPQSILSEGVAGSVKGGDRLPWVKMSTGPDADNFACLTTMQWQVHCYGDASPRLQTWCHTKHIKLNVFPWSGATKKAGLKKNTAYVIRPDGYIGLAEKNGNSEKVAAYFDGHGIIVNE